MTHTVAGLHRSTPLVRRTPLARGTTRMRRTPMPRTPAPKSHTAAAAAGGVPTATRELVLARDCSRCVRCGRWTIGAPRSIHHRRPRGMGGARAAHDPANLILVCGDGCSGCHGWIESNRSAALDLGWLVRSGDEPDSVAVLVQWLGWCWPGDEWTPVT